MSDTEVDSGPNWYQKLLANLHIYASLFNGRDLSPSTIHPRAMPRLPCFWCLPMTQTAVAINAFNDNFWPSTHSPIILEFLSEVLREVREHLHTNSDGPIPNGYFFFNRYGLHLFAMNDNNHQVTWGVMGAAIEALTNFMIIYGFGPMRFTITDGLNVVGRGLLQGGH